jgi:ribosomal protein S2
MINNNKTKIKDTKFKKSILIINQLFFYKIYTGTNELLVPTSLYMFEYILKIKKNVNIINLEKTMFLLKKSLKIIKFLCNKKIIFIENIQFNKNINIIKNTAIHCKKKSIFGEWKGGIISNFRYRKRSKKDKIIKQRINSIPHLILLFNGQDSLVIKEAFKKNIPIICYTNTHIFSKYLTYKVPWNDNSLYSLFFICHLIKLTILEGKFQVKINLEIEKQAKLKLQVELKKNNQQFKKNNQQFKKNNQQFKKNNQINKNN